jgi:hypothetical protein
VDFQSWSGGQHIVLRGQRHEGGVASANGVVKVGPSTGIRISGVVLDDDGDPMEGVLVNTDLASSRFAAPTVMVGLFCGT